MTKKVTQARKGLGTNLVGLATELSLVSKLLQKVIQKKISALGRYPVTREFSLFFIWIFSVLCIFKRLLIFISHPSYLKEHFSQHHLKWNSASASCAEIKPYWSVNWSFLGDLWRRSCIRGALLAVLFGSAWTSLGSRKENEKRRLTPQEWNSLQSDCVTLRPYFCTKLRFEIWHLLLFTAYGAYRHRTYNLFAMN